MKAPKHHSFREEQKKKIWEKRPPLSGTYSPPKKPVYVRKNKRISPEKRTMKDCLQRGKVPAGKGKHWPPLNVSYSQRKEKESTHRRSPVRKRDHSTAFLGPGERRCPRKKMCSDGKMLSFSENKEEKSGLL